MSLLTGLLGFVLGILVTTIIFIASVHPNAHTRALQHRIQTQNKSIENYKSIIRGQQINDNELMARYQRALIEKSILFRELANLRVHSYIENGVKCFTYKSSLACVK